MQEAWQRASTCVTLQINLVFAITLSKLSKLGIPKTPFEVSQK
jgi:hypothetical protein